MTEEVGNDGLTDAERKQFARHYYEKVVKPGFKVPLPTDPEERGIVLDLHREAGWNIELVGEE